jgi:hypothetical protein
MNDDKNSLRQRCYDLIAAGGIDPETEHGLSAARDEKHGLPANHTPLSLCSEPERLAVLTSSGHFINKAENSFLFPA